MALLKKEIDGVEYSYQLPLNFDDQLALISTISSMTIISGNVMRIDFGKVWAFIKKDISIEKDDKVVIKDCVFVPDFAKEALKFSKEACDFVYDEFANFLKEQGISL